MKYNKVDKHITNWLKEYIESNNLKGFVIGVSGGIDSSVASTLCAKTGLPLLVVEMPIHQEENLNVAKNHIKFLKERFNNVESVEIDLTSTFDVMKYSLDLGNGEKVNLSLANTRSRLRMATLYSLATIRGSVVCGTGNKVEDFGLFFYTKYGDGGVDISPIADLMKSEVYLLGKELGLINEVLNAVPTDGLWEGSPTDEEQLGGSYDEFEWCMNFVKEWWFWESGMEYSGFLDYDFDTNKSKTNEEDINLSDREKTILRIYLQRHKQGLHKSLPIPICNIPNNLR